MAHFQQLCMLLIIPLILWITGLVGQKVLAFTERNDFKVNTNNKLVFLLGLRPGVQPVYIRPAALQMIGLVAALAGGVAWIYEPATAKKFVNTVLLLGFTIVIIGLVILDTSSRMRELK